ncbi:hypothetical protein ACQR35_12185 [Pseudarthrobacter sp. J1738]|uniref:hypothetical protein n=1 Tax=Micrococcales TaxID=85006 RepID=UPI003B82079D
MTKAVVTNELLLTEITRLLAESEIIRVDNERHPSWPVGSMAFEDEYSVIAIWTFESVEELVAGWGAAQDHVVDFLGANVIATDPKSWDGYLILVAMDGVPEELAAELSSIRSDTRRVRKLVLTADDLPTRVTDPLELTPQVRRTLAPILDLDLDTTPGRADPLATLPSRIAGSLSGSNAHLDVVIAAYEAGDSPLEALHERLIATQRTGTDAP